MKNNALWKILRVTFRLPEYPRPPLNTLKEEMIDHLLWFERDSTLRNYPALDKYADKLVDMITLKNLLQKYLYFVKVRLHELFSL